MEQESYNTLEPTVAAAVTQSSPVLRVNRQGVYSCEDYDVLRECLLRIVIDGVPLIRLSCTPTDVEELVLGRLFTEGLIHGFEDIEAMGFNWDGRNINAFVEAAPEARERMGEGLHAESLLSSSGCLAPNPSSWSTTSEVAPSLEWSTDDVFALCDRFFGDSPLHATTSGTHSCYFFLDGEMLYMAEDIGRHNALDKVIGRALKRDADFAQSAVFLSGRVPTDMIRKAIRAGITLVVTKAVPTSEAIELARAHGISLVGKATCDGFVVFVDGR